MLLLQKFSLGVGDRFGRQAAAQLRACMQARAAGVELAPVWNKSNREHLTIGSEPASVRAAADAAARQLGWRQPYYVDADHIRLETVDRFLAHADFFTIDVADFIGQAPDSGALAQFLERHREFSRPLELPGIDAPLAFSPEMAARAASKHLRAAHEASKICRRIANAKGDGNFIAEVSMDETDAPQTPPELLIILAALADAGVPLQTIAPKFAGRFNKGVDYQGDLAQFEQEFNNDLAVIAAAARRYPLPETLKLSVHSGSDKFSIYGPMRRALLRFDAGVHLKTAGTTWLEELIGLAEAGGDGLAMAKEIYREAAPRAKELCAPYAAVIDLDPRRLPMPEDTEAWTGEEFAAALRHDPSCPEFNPNFRQLLHVSYKIAAQKGRRFTDLLDRFAPVIGPNVTGNLWNRHIRPLFLGSSGATGSID